MLSSQYNPLFWAVENIVSDSNKEVLFSHYYIYIQDYTSLRNFFFNLDFILKIY